MIAKLVRKGDRASLASDKIAATANSVCSCLSYPLGRRCLAGFVLEYSGAVKEEKKRS